MRIIFAVVAGMVLCESAQAQNMLSKAMYDCIKQGHPVHVADLHRDPTLYTWFCEGYAAAALFSELRGRAKERANSNASVSRSAGRGLSCTRGQSGAADCLISIELSKELLDAMR